MNESTSTKTAGQRCADDLAALLRARNPLLVCVSREEARSERIIMEASAAAGYTVLTWDCGRGICEMDGSQRDADAKDPNQAMEGYCNPSRERRVLIMRDLHKWLGDPTVNRSVRNLCRVLPQYERDRAKALVILTPTAEIPPELAGHAIVIDIPLPDRAEIAQLLDGALASLPEEMRKGASPNGHRESAIDAAIGLTAEEAQATFARSLIVAKKIDPVTVGNEKRRIIAKERTLEWVTPLAAGLDGVGGLELLKTWLIQRRSAFSKEARAYGLPAPKGVLMVGVPGCGKSLCAKAIAAAWELPLLRLDMGALKSKWVGESEGNIRKALKLAETIAPCVLWLDEIEKALGGASQGAADGGVSQDALGTILTWMQDNTAGVFVVATANNLAKLGDDVGPLVRKGRFDDVFFVDVPTTTERAAILCAAMREHKRTETIDGAAIAAATVDFIGAEIAALIPDAMFAAFADGARPITTDDVLRAASTVVPLAKTATETIVNIRKWAAGRARPASLADRASVRNARTLDLE